MPVPVATNRRSPLRRRGRVRRAPARLERRRVTPAAPTSPRAGDLVLPEPVHAPGHRVLGEVGVGVLVDRVGLAVLPVLQELHAGPGVVDLVEVHVEGLGEVEAAQHQRADDQQDHRAAGRGGSAGRRAPSASDALRSRPERRREDPRAPMRPGPRARPAPPSAPGRACRARPVAQPSRLGRRPAPAPPCPRPAHGARAVGHRARGADGRPPPRPPRARTGRATRLRRSSPRRRTRSTPVWSTTASSTNVKLPGANRSPERQRPRCWRWRRRAS